MTLNLAPNLPFAHGADVSVWQDDNSTPQQIDFDKMAASSVSFVGIKISEDQYTDQDFIYNWNNAKRKNMLRIGYHYLHWKDPKQQARAFFGAYKNDPPELLSVADYERRKGAPGRAAMTDILYDFLEELKRLNNLLDKRKPMESIYTGISFWKEYGSPAAYWKQYPLWLAWYANKITQAHVPAPWDKWTLWQFGTPAIGRLLGAESAEIDMNYYNGTEAELYKFFGLQAPEQPQQPQQPEEPHEPEYMKVDSINWGLKLRSIPESGSRLAVLDHNTQVEVLERKKLGTDVWCRVRIEGWSAEKHNGYTYLKR